MEVESPQKDHNHDFHFDPPNAPRGSTRGSTRGSPLKRGFSEIPANVSPEAYRKHRSTHDMVSPLVYSPRKRTRPSSAASAGAPPAASSAVPSAGDSPARPPPIRRPYRTITKESVQGCQNEMLARELRRAERIMKNQEDQIMQYEVQLRQRTQQSLRSGEHLKQLEQLRSSVENLLDAKRMLEDEIAELRRALDERAVDIDDLSRRADAEASRADAEASRAAKQAAAAEGARADAAAARDELAAAATQISALRGEIERRAAEIAGLHATQLAAQQMQQTQTQSAADEAAALRQQLAELSAAQLRADEQQRAFEQRTAEIRQSALDTETRHRARVAELTAALEAQNALLAQREAAQHGESDTLRERLRAVEAALSDARSDLAAVCRERDSLEASARQLRDVDVENERFRTSQAELRQRQSALDEQLAAADERHRVLQRSLAQAQSERAAAIKEAERVHSEAQRRDQNALRMLDNLRHLTTEREETLGAEIRAHAQRVAVLRSERDAFANELGEARNQIERLGMNLNNDGSIEAERRADARAQQLAAELMAERQRVRALQNTVQDLKGNIRLVARVRPARSVHSPQCDLQLDQTKVALRQKCSPVIAGSSAKETLLEAMFDRVFGPDSSNPSVAEETDYLIQSALDGRVVSILAYGQTGSGKSHTMNGKGGVTAHALSTIMRDATAADSNMQVYVEAVEVYNEQFRDLLKGPEPARSNSNSNSNGNTNSNSSTSPVGASATPAANTGAPGGSTQTQTLLTTSAYRAELSLKQDARTRNYVLSGATRVDVSTETEALDAMARALRLRTTAATAANERSSRSHFVFSVHVLKFSPGKSDPSAHGVLHLVDLAGSERTNESKVTGIHMNEATSINKSLTTLKRVINSLMTNDATKTQSKFVPFRESKLTMLLQGSFVGEAKTMLLLALAPEVSSIEETKSTLRFAVDASSAVVR